MFRRKTDFRATTRQCEISGAFDGGLSTAMSHGFPGTTLIATSLGWRPIESLAEGDLVLTFDNGPQPVAAIRRGVIGDLGGVCADGQRPLAVPAGLVGNTAAMTLLPDQVVMVESDMAELQTGDPFALIPAAALDGMPGVQRIEGRALTRVVSLGFAEDEVIFLKNGALGFCPGAVRDLPGFMHMGMQGQGPYDVLPLDEARDLVAEIYLDTVTRTDASGAALRPAEAEGAVLHG